LGFQSNTTPRLACSSSGFQILTRGRDCHAEANTLEIIQHRFKSVSGSECFLAFPRNFANASLREYLFFASRGGIAIRLSKAVIAAWSIASVITSLCVIKFLQRVS